MPASQRVAAALRDGAARQGRSSSTEVIRRKRPEEVVFLARSRTTGDWLEIGIRCSKPAEPYGIRGLRFERLRGSRAPAGRPERAPTRRPPPRPTRCSRSSRRPDEFSGVVLMAKDGKPFFHQAYGLADRGLGAPNRPDTKFNLGSINKIFTQTAIAQLAEKGKLSFTDTIRKHLPDYPLAAADRITIQQL